MAHVTKPIPGGQFHSADGISGSSSSRPNLSVRLTPAGRASIQARSNRYPSTYVLV